MSFFILTIFLLICPVIVSAGGFCPPHETEIEIKNLVTPERLKYDYSRSVNDLIEMSNKNATTTRIFGLFSRKVFATMSFPVEQWTDVEKLWCPKKIIVNVAVDFDPTIYVAKEFFEGTDAYNYVSWHENEHARIVIENNKRYLPYLEQELKRYVGGLRMYIPLTRREGEDSIDYMRVKMSDIILENITKLNQMIDDANKDFDQKEKNHARWVNSIYERIIKNDY